jgi:hypothetical protein
MGPRIVGVQSGGRAHDPAVVAVVTSQDVVARAAVQGVGLGASDEQIITTVSGS